VGNPRRLIKILNNGVKRGTAKKEDRKVSFEGLVPLRHKAHKTKRVQEGKVGCCDGKKICKQRERRVW